MYRVRVDIQDLLDVLSSFVANTGTNYLGNNSATLQTMFTKMVVKKMSLFARENMFQQSSGNSEYEDTRV